MITLSKTAPEKVNKKYDAKLEIYPNGYDNLYTETAEYLRNESVTATMASDLMAQYLIGKGLGAFDKVEVYGQKLQVIYSQIAKSVTDNKGCFIKFSYNANYGVAGFEVLDFKTCRIGRKDSKEYNGKILISKDWSDVKKNKPLTYNVYNPDVDIVKYQMGILPKDKESIIFDKVLAFTGQVAFYTQMPEYHYPLSRYHSAFKDCNIERLGSVYVENLMLEAFMNKTMIVTRPLIEEGLVRESIENPNGTDAQIYRIAKTEEEEFKSTIKDMVGVDNSGGILVMQVDFKGDKLEDALLVKSLDSNIKPDLFDAQIIKAQQKILVAFNNLPISLVKANETLFGAGGESLRVAKELFWESTSFERIFCEQIINDAMLQLDSVIVKEPIKVLPLFAAAKSQNELAKTVGGVQALLQIVQNVNDRTLDYSAAVAIVRELYGLDEITAKSFLGTPNIVTPTV